MRMLERNTDRVRCLWIGNNDLYITLIIDGWSESRVFAPLDHCVGQSCGKV